MQSGKPVGIFKTHTDAPRVLIANSNLVPFWATQEHFDELAAKGLIMYGQMTAGSWIYIGTQGILQGTYETLGSLAAQQGWPSLKGKFVLTAGLGGMGGAQPLAVTMNEGVALVVEVDPDRAQKRLEIGYIDVVTDNLEDAMTQVEEAIEQQIPKSIGLIANAADVYTELLLRNVIPDVLTDQTSAHDPLSYVPSGMSLTAAYQLRQSDPQKYIELSLKTMAKHVEAMVGMQKAGAITFDYGNNIRQRAYDQGVKEAFNFPGFVPAYIRPLFCEGKGPFRWVALSGDPEDIYKTDEKLMELFPEDQHLHRWLKMAKEQIPFQGLPSRICWLGYDERDKAGLAFNEMVADGNTESANRNRSRPSDAGSVASPTARPKPCRWYRCDQRLAHSERSAKYRQRRHLGELPPRRWGWHWLFATRRTSDRGGRNARSRQTTQTRFDWRPRYGRHSSCRCWLSRSH